MEITIEEKKAYLKSYQRIKKEIRSLDDEIRSLRAGQIFPGIVADGMPKGNGFCDLSVYAARLDELQCRLGEKAEKLIRRQEEIEADIDRMEDPIERALLRNKYIGGMTWEQVAVGMGYSWQYIHKIHSRALKHFEKEAIESDSHPVI